MRTTVRASRPRVGHVMRGVERQVDNVADSAGGLTRKAYSVAGAKDKNNLFALHIYAESGCLAKGKRDVL
jgi:transposase, IS5 family